VCLDVCLGFAEAGDLGWFFVPVRFNLFVRAE